MGICQKESSILIQRDLETGITLENLIVYDDDNEITNEPTNKVRSKANNMSRKFKASIDDIGERISIDQFLNTIPGKYSSYSNENPLKLKTQPDISQLISSDPIKLHNENIYWGTWNEECQMEGQGKLYSIKDNAYAEGLWEMGILRQGRIMFSDNSIYEGDITKNTFNGDGKVIYPNGSIYEGKFTEGQREGRGSMKWLDGSTYWGEFHYDEMTGEGEMNWSEGYSYRGQMNHNMLEGKGILTGPNKSKYEGEFKSNMFHGEGKYKWGSGQLYKGAYCQGKRNGKGLYVIDQYQAFKGFFVNEQHHGYGAIITDSMVYKGLWRNGLFIEKGEEVHNDPMSNHHHHLKVIDSDINMESITIPNMTFKPIQEDMNPSCLEYLSSILINKDSAENFIPNVNIEEAVNKSATA